MIRPLQYRIARLAVVLIMSGLAISCGAAPMQTIERCGWLDNSSPGNVSLFDGKDEWVLAMQGRPGARGRWPSIDPADKVTGGRGSYGYGCACLTMNVQGDKVVSIRKGAPRRLAECRQTSSLREVERLLQ
jgi:hypothetical protein